MRCEREHSAGRRRRCWVLSARMCFEQQAGWQASLSSASKVFDYAAASISRFALCTMSRRVEEGDKCALARNRGRANSPPVDPYQFRLYRFAILIDYEEGSMRGREVVHASRHLFRRRGGRYRSAATSPSPHYRIWPGAVNAHQCPAMPSMPSMPSMHRCASTD